MCEMFLRDDDLMTRHQIYQVYTKHNQEECFDVLNDFYKSIEEKQDEKKFQIEDVEMADE